MQLTILGTATPYPVPGNACSGYLLQGGSTSLWIDAGTGTLAELQRHIALTDLDAIFISHRHADHTADLLVAYYALRFSSLSAGSPWVGAASAPNARPQPGPRRRIPVFGPGALVDRLAEFLGPDALQGLHEVFDFTEMSGWADAVVGDLALSWGPVSHGVPAFALTVRGPGGAALSTRASTTGPSTSPTSTTRASTSPPSTFTYSGDTAPCISLVEMAEESSVLLCEVGYNRDALGEPAVHHTPEDAGRTGTAAGVSTIILTHIADDLAPADAARRASAHFAGTVELAVPGLTFSV
ncbi:MAG: metal-dependent hydrolase, beta-lactamase superfamily [Subtercola sp.]|nr:metal-dependent hydrolase, beta-lactamase superfamily [Subtercola sp.]